MASFPECWGLLARVNTRGGFGWTVPRIQAFVASATRTEDVAHRWMSCVGSKLLSAAGGPRCVAPWIQSLMSRMAGICRDLGLCHQWTSCILLRCCTTPSGSRRGDTAQTRRGSGPGLKRFLFVLWAKK